MIIASIVACAGSAVMLVAAVLFTAQPASVARAQSQSNSAAPMAARISGLIPDLEAYIRNGMKAYDVPGLAVGIVTGDRLVYAKGFGVREFRAFDLVAQRSGLPPQVNHLLGLSG